MTLAQLSANPLAACVKCLGSWCVLIPTLCHLSQLWPLAIGSLLCSGEFLITMKGGDYPDKVILMGSSRPGILSFKSNCIWPYPHMGKETIPDLEFSIASEV